MPMLHGCCGCFDLKIGTKIIGIVGLILNLLNFLLVAVFLILFAAVESTVVKMLEEAKDEQYRQVGLNPETENSTMKREYAEQIDLLIQNVHLVKFFLLVILVLFLIDIIFTSCLIHGVRRNRRGLLGPWIFLHIVYIIIELAMVVAFITGIAYLPVLWQFILPLIAVTIIWMGIHLYLVLVVISQYQALGLIRMHEEEMPMK